jgi:plasmid stabilization system protein ParE
MKPYVVKITPQANRDIRTVTHYIRDELFAPTTAEKFLRGIYARIATLSDHADVFAASSYRDVLRYGDNARHITYKGFAVIYTIHGNRVLVHRIIHGSLIKE